MAQSRKITGDPVKKSDIDTKLLSKSEGKASGSSKKYSPEVMRRIRAVELKKINNREDLTSLGKSVEAQDLDRKMGNKYSPAVSVQKHVDAQQKAKKEGKSPGSIYVKKK